jgi:hypothetical protein
MKIQIMKKPLVAAVAACVLGGASLPAVADDAMMKRMEMLEQQLKALKEQMAAQSTASTAAAPAVKVKNGGSLTFGGYLKADYRHVDGDLGYQDYWRGNSSGNVDDTEHTGFSAKESRLNMKYQKGDVTGYVEVDFYGGGGNEVATNSTSPRLRHAFIKTGNWLVGQYWTAFTPIKAFPEALDFGGPIVGEVFVRQPQIRYTNGNFTVSIENPETWGDGDVGINGVGGGQGAAGADVDETTPDLIAAYNFKGDWGEVQVAGLIRKVEVDDGYLSDTEGDATFAGFSGESETAFAINVGGRLNVGERDDFRFQINHGESGRYVGAGMVPDFVTDTDAAAVTVTPDLGDATQNYDVQPLKIEETTAYTMAYRHFWNNDWRSTVYYGAAETDVSEIDRSHWGLNLIRQLSPGLTAGVEFGQFSVDDNNGVDESSNYLQMSWKYAL